MGCTLQVDRTDLAAIEALRRPIIGDYDIRPARALVACVKRHQLNANTPRATKAGRPRNRYIMCSRSGPWSVGHGGLVTIWVPVHVPDSTYDSDQVVRTDDAWVVLDRGSADVALDRGRHDSVGSLKR